MKLFYSLLLGCIFSMNLSAQSVEHIDTIFSQYQSKIEILESKVITYNSDTNRTQEDLKEIVRLLRNINPLKFDLDSAFVEYEYLSKRVLLDKILTKDKMKNKNREELKKELLAWNYYSCHPKSDQIWHSVSRFFYENETNTAYFMSKKESWDDKFTVLAIEDYVVNKLPYNIKNQKKIIDLIRKDIK